MAKNFWDLLHRVNNMNVRDNLRKRSARLGYNIGFGARRHFATNEIVEKVPTYFGVITFAFGMIFLKYPHTGLSDFVALLTSVVGGAIVYLNFYSHAKDEYEKIGKELNTLYGQTHTMYEQLYYCEESEFPAIESSLKSIDEKLQKISIHKQVFFSNELAHFKLFGESQSDWFVDELKLTFWKDKIPAIWRIYFLLTFFAIIALLLWNSSIFTKLSECIGAR